MPAAKTRGWRQTAGRFVFKHRRSAYHLRHIAALYQRMHEAVRASVHISQAEEPTNSGYSGPLLDELYYNLDGFFEAMRAAHDSSPSCLCSAGLLSHSPSSLHDFSKKQEKLFGHPVRSASAELLLEFWRATGAAAKDYRDCLSHYVSLSGPTWQHGANARWANGEWTLSVHLPDNPQARTYEALSFSSRLDALVLCSRLQRETDALVVALLHQAAEHWQVDPTACGAATFTISNVVLGE